MNIDLAVEVACKLGERWEGTYLHPYLDSVGVPTIGRGFTYYEDGTPVTLNDPPITIERCNELQLWLVRNRYLPAVMKLCPGIDEPDRLAAIIDFCYNLGSSNLKISTLRKRINQKRWEEVPKEIMKWNKAGGRVLNGLTKRRQAEANLI